MRRNFANTRGRHYALNSAVRALQLLDLTHTAFPEIVKSALKLLKLGQLLACLISGDRVLLALGNCRHAPLRLVLFVAEPEEDQEALVEAASEIAALRTGVYL